ncbi:uncharacterized [Tachysurus ichikawai]
MTDFLLKRRCAPSGTGQQMRVEAARAVIERAPPLASTVSINLHGYQTVSNITIIDGRLGPLGLEDLYTNTVCFTSSQPWRSERKTAFQVPWSYY